VWSGFLQQLTTSNPTFAAIYNRYLQSDNLSVKIGTKGQNQ
jgi:hypothetical protein